MKLNERVDKLLRIAKRYNFMYCKIFTHDLQKLVNKSKAYDEIKIGAKQCYQSYEENCAECGNVGSCILEDMCGIHDSINSEVKTLAN